MIYLYTDRDSGQPVKETGPLMFGVPGGRIGEMELKAIIEALKWLMRKPPIIAPDLYDQVVIYTDSRYVERNLDRARGSWRTQGARNRHGRPVSNWELWDQLLKLIDKMWSKLRKKVRIEWTPGKSHKVLKEVDKLAKKSADIPIGRPVSTVRSRRKKSEKSTEAGSIGQLGQMLTLRIIDDEPMKKARATKYRCEVVSKKSPFYGNVDFLYAEGDIEGLDRGHTYPGETRHRHQEAQHRQGLQEDRIGTRRFLGSHGFRAAPQSPPLRCRKGTMPTPCALGRFFRRQRLVARAGRRVDRRCFCRSVQRPTSRSSRSGCT